MKSALYSLFVLLLLSACQSGSDDPFANCPQGKPTAIFSDSLQQIVKHKFAIDKNFGVEYIQFNNGVYLEIYQGGCELVQQEFRFRLPGKSPRDDRAFWVDQAIAQMRFLGEQSERHMAFASWAQAIEKEAGKIQLGQEFNLDSNIFTRIDRINSSDHTILIIELFQKNKYK